ncbi:MAG: toll/interleukin-1 receptor domain-containing protein [Clostridia bacterium]|nr:toll/interleukin-1 receptor domain-containing protein [Clostridia bacterium]
MGFRAYEGNEPYIFISYAHKDISLVMPIIEGLAAKGFRIWYDAGIEAGTEWPEYIAEHLENCAAFVAFISEAAIASKNCRREINFAIDLDKEPLAIYLEEVRLTAGMRMQLGTLQAMFYYRHHSLDSFIDSLCEARNLQKCCVGGSVNTATAAPKSYDDYTSLFNSLTKTPVDTSNASTFSTGAAPAMTLPPLPASSLTPEEATQINNEASDLYSSGEYAKAYPMFVRAAEAGNTYAMYNLGLCYENGNGTQQNYQLAAEWYKRGADGGHVSAAGNLGYLYEMGRGVSQSYENAVYYYRKAADAGNKYSQCNLAFCYETGRGVPKNYSEAAKWYQRSADQGYPRALNNLALLYEAGNGVPKDYKTATDLYRKAADQGYAVSQGNLAYCYEVGRGVPKDTAEAVKWYTKAAMNGNARSQCNLGYCYDEGIGVARNPAEAVKWYTKAADPHI